MRIHITTDNPGQAAWEMYERLQATTGKWVIHSCGKEGFVAGRLGTRFGDALARYVCAEGLCGVYRADSLPAFKQFKADLKLGWREYLRTYGDAADRQRDLIDRRGYSKHTTFTPLSELAEQALRKTGHHTVVSLAAELKASRTATSTAVKALLDSGRAKVVRMLPSNSPRGGVPVRVIGVAA
jgi:hypothetical protein